MEASPKGPNSLVLRLLHRFGLHPHSQSVMSAAMSEEDKVHAGVPRPTPAPAQGDD